MAYTWTKEMDEILIALRKNGASWAVIGDSLGIPFESCRNHFQQKLSCTEKIEPIPFSQKIRLQSEIKQKAKNKLSTRKCLMCRRHNVKGWSYCHSCRLLLPHKDTPFDC